MRLVPVASASLSAGKSPSFTIARSALPLSAFPQCGRVSVAARGAVGSFVVALRRTWKLATNGDALRYCYRCMKGMRQKERQQREQKVAEQDGIVTLFGA